jgi:sulfatase maturation enzyme AslB (radical SAM superfamily)
MNNQNPIEITSVIPIGMNREQADKLAQNLARTMRSMWAAEGGPKELSPKEFCVVALNYCGTPESRKFLADKLKEIFSEKMIKEIITSKNDSIKFTFNGEEVTINAKSPQPA